MSRKWRGEIDVPLTEAGLGKAYETGAVLNAAGGLTVCYHDWLSRDRDTANAICDFTIESRGPRPWRMGKSFEGYPITAESIRWAQWLVENPTLNLDPTGEPWLAWYEEWRKWLSAINDSCVSSVGIVTHNRNIQAIYSTVKGEFRPEFYNCDGPGFCSIHFYDGLTIVPWVGDKLVTGIYLVRHGETEWGT